MVLAADLENSNFRIQNNKKTIELCAPFEFVFRNRNRGGRKTTKSHHQSKLMFRWGSTHIRTRRRSLLLIKNTFPDKKAIFTISSIISCDWPRLVVFPEKTRRRSAKILLICHRWHPYCLVGSKITVIFLFRNMIIINDFHRFLRASSICTSSLWAEGGEWPASCWLLKEKKSVFDLIWLSSTLPLNYPACSINQHPPNSVCLCKHH